MEPTNDTSLTLPDLVDALRELLAEGYSGTRSGRVRDLPDARTIRWYQTLGLVDRPAHFRGRTALFGRRHLLQLAAIKKLQECLGTWHDLEELVEFLRGCRRKWKPADNPLAGRLTHVLTYFQGEQEVAFAEVKNLLREDPAWHKKVKLLLPHDESIALSRPADRG